MPMLMLNVPFAQKEEAKALGARWNQAEKKWYVPDHVDPAPFLARPEWTDPEYVPPPQVPGKGPKWPLYVDLIPRTAWFSNLRSELNEAEWTALKRRTFDAAGWVCEVCTCKGPKWPVECHERFNYDEETGVQTLTGTIALCPSCHESTHMGFARTRGREAEAMAHLMAVNGWTDPEARQHVQEAMRTYGRRSARDWQFDARWLLGRLDLSEETREKIMGHAEGLAPRIVTEEQQGIRDAHAYEGQDNGLFDDFFHQPN